MTEAITRDLWRDYVVASLGIAAVLELAGHVVLPWPEVWQGSVLRWAMLVLAALAVWTLAAGVGNARRVEERAFWRTLALAYALYLAAGVSTALAGRGPSPWPVQALPVLYYFVVIVAVGLRPHWPSSRSSLRLRLYRILGAALAVFTLYAYFGSIPATLAPGTSWANPVVRYFYLVVDAGLGAYLLRLGHAGIPDRWRRVYRLLGVAFACWAIAGLLTALHVLGPRWGEPSTTASTVYQLLPLVLVVAAGRYRRVGAAQGDGAESDGTGDPDDRARGVPNSMYAAFIALLHIALPSTGAFDGAVRHATDLLVLVSLPTLFILSWCERRELRSRRWLEESVERRGDGRFLEFLDLAPDALYLNDLQGVLLDGNRAAERLTGYSRAELIGKSLLAAGLLSVWQVPKAAALLVRNALGQATGPDDFVLRRRDGACVEVEINTRPVRGREGTVVLGIARDVSARKRAEREAVETHRRLEFLLQKGPAVIYIAGRSTERVISFVSGNVETLLGYTYTELLSTPTFFRSLLASDAVPRLAGAMKTLLDRGRISVEYAVRHRDGRRIVLRDEMTLVRDADGDPLEVIGSWVDVSALRAADEALRRMNMELESQVELRTSELAAVLRQKSLLAAAIEQTDDAVFVTDTQAWFVYVNPAFEGITGYKSEEVVGRKPSMLKSGRHEPAFYAEMWRTILAGSVWRGELVNRRNDGSFYLADTTIAPVRGPGGEITHFVAIQRNITAQVASQLALAESQARLAEILEHSSNLFYACTPDQQLTYVSPQVRGFLGCEPDEASGRLADFVTDASLNETGLAASRRAVETGERQPPFELELRGGSGRVIRVEVNETPVIEDGRVVRLVGALTDITERRRIEEEWARVQVHLQQADRMDAIGRLAGGIAHDFNNLLLVIVGHCELALSNPETDPTTDDHLRQIRAAAKRGEALTRQLLAFSRRQVAKPLVVDLNPVVSDTTEMLRRTIGRRVDLVLNLEPGPTFVEIDPSHVSQVLTNLVVNARDAMPGGGTVTIETATVDPSRDELKTVQIAGPHVRISVRDTGVGMSPEVQAHAFEPFFTTKARDRGTGLGLSIVYGLIKQHGGHITLHSLVGEGTTFTVYLPVVERDADEPLRGGLFAAPSGTETILLVDDDADVRPLVAEMLERLGYRVLDAGSAAAAVQIFQRGEPRVDLLFTDLVMPGIGGRTLASQLLSLRQGLPVLYMSGFDDDVADADDESDLGTFIWKPFDSASLASKVREALDAVDKPPARDPMPRTGN